MKIYKIQEGEKHHDGLDSRKSGHGTPKKTEGGGNAAGGHVLCSFGGGTKGGDCQRGDNGGQVGG